MAVTPAKPHPEHHVALSADGLWLPVPPVPESSRGRQRAAEGRCRRAGGHYWHPLDTDRAGRWVWFCCGCGFKDQRAGADVTS